ncbi:hypothetical protein CXG81DRAFT_9305, partial [Caulochytrium protostelioides]
MDAGATRGKPYGRPPRPTYATRTTESSGSVDDAHDEAFVPLPRNLGSRLTAKNWEQLMPTLPPFNKNFYYEHPDVTNRPPWHIDQWRESYGVRVTPGALRPVETLEEAGFANFVKVSIFNRDLVQPTPIQSQGWPMAMSGQDLVGVADTGSGKTLAYVLPALMHIAAQEPLKEGQGPIALILVPTRELALQIEQIFHDVGSTCQLRCACLWGGGGHKSMELQCASLMGSPDCIVATPGRLIEMLELGKTNLMRVTYLVLDEADRMLDMGFHDQIEMISSQIRPDRQTLMWTATWTEDIMRLASKHLKQPQKVVVGQYELSVPASITQHFVFTSPAQRDTEFLKLLSGLTAQDQTLIFTNSKHHADEVERLMVQHNYHVLVTHGDKPQNEREFNMSAFKSGNFRFLIATDILARGMDFKGVTHVINYMCPVTVEAYIHRVGRTGRMDRPGVAHTLFVEDDFSMAPHLIDLLTKAGQPVPAELQDYARLG